MKKAAKSGDKKAVVAVAVVEGKMTKKQAASALKGKGRDVPPDMKKELAALDSSKGDAKALDKRFKDSEKKIGEGAYGLSLIHI